jgi:two-component system NtrC family sensor kinase
MSEPPILRLTSRLQPDEILEAALSQLIALAHAELGCVWWREQHSRGNGFFAVQGASPKLAEQLVDWARMAGLDREIEAQVGPVVVDDIRTSPLRQWLPAPILEEGYVSFLVTALRTRGEVQGAAVLAARAAGPFGHEEGALVSALSEQVSVALDNACLYAETQQRAEEMSSLYDLSLAATSLNPEDILRLIGDRVLHLLGATCFLVALVDEERRELRLAHVVDRGQVQPPLTIPLGQEAGLTGYVLASGQPLLVEDLSAESARLPAAPIHVGEAAHSWLGVPLIAKGRTIGVMSIQAYAPAAFNEGHQRLLSLAAQQAASALENARLYQQARALERRYHKLLEDLNDGYAVLQDGRVVFANARLGQMLGCAPKAVVASSLEELLGHQEPEHLAVPSPVEPGAEPAHYRTYLRRSDGSELPAEVTLSWIEYEGRPALAVLCRDISSQVRLEAQLLQAEKLSAVGQLVSGVAHELNNPLTTIKGYAQLLQGEGVPPSAVADLKRVEEAADRCRRIVRDLLTFARRYEPECTDTDVNDLLQRTLALRSYELRLRNIQVHWALDPALPSIQADPHRLQQVIVNLVFNAEQALLSVGHGGCISIRSQALPDGEHIRFEINDNGPGIRPEYLDRIFDPFFTTKEVGMGTGLGLSISYGIVREHGGRIWAESQFDAGATFFVELPLVAPQPSAPQKEL